MTHHHARQAAYGGEAIHFFGLDVGGEDAKIRMRCCMSWTAKQGWYL